MWSSEKISHVVTDSYRLNFLCFSGLTDRFINITDHNY